MQPHGLAVANKQIRLTAPDWINLAALGTCLAGALIYAASLLAGSGLV